MAEIISTALFSDGSLKGYYRFNSGALTSDASSNGRLLTNNNTVGEIVNGKYGYAADGGSANTNKYFSRADDFGISGGTISIAFWVKMNTEISTGQQVFCVQEDAGTQVGYYVQYNYNAGSRKLDFIRIKEGVSQDTFSYTVSLGTSDFHHICLTYDNTNIRAYFDGSLVGTLASSGVGSGAVTDQFAVLASVGGTNPASAIIDDLAVFNKALSLAEVVSLFETSTGGSSSSILYLLAGM